MKHHSLRKSFLRSELTDIVGSQHVLTDPADLLAYGGITVDLKRSNRITELNTNSGFIENVRQEVF